MTSTFLCVPQDFRVLERSYCLYVVKPLKEYSNKNFSSVKTMWLQTKMFKDCSLEIFISALIALTIGTLI